MSDYKDTKSYEQGFRAYQDGVTDCPYNSHELEDKHNKRRKLWWMGWYDAKIQTTLSDEFEKHGVTY